MEPLLINTALIDLFEKKVQKTNNKAAKLGMPAVGVTYGKTELHPAGSDTIGSYIRIDSNGRKECVALYTEVFLQGDAPVIEGYEFVATVDLRGEAPMVKRQPFTAEDVDLTPYFENDGHCDHCNSVRQRNDVLILRDTASGELIQIGRNCAADFFRSKEARAMVAVCDWVDAYGNVPANERLAEPRTQVQRMYEVAAAVVRTFGWVRHQDVRYDNTLVSTRSRVWANLFPWPKMPVEDRVKVTKEDEIEAEKVMEWLKTCFLDKPADQRSEFENNVCAAVENYPDYPMVRNRNLNYLIWGIAGYQRDLQKEAEQRRIEAAKAAQRGASDYVGKVGERTHFELTLKFKRAFGSEFGTKYLQKFEDVDGNVVVWWGTNDTAARTVVGNTYVFKATIKGHDEYDGVKQTCLTRATLVEGELGEE